MDTFKKVLTFFLERFCVGDGYNFPILLFGYWYAIPPFNLVTV